MKIVLLTIKVRIKKVVDLTDNLMKGRFSGPKQFLTTENPFKMTKNAFYSC